jgi:hypothetical protein
MGATMPNPERVFKGCGCRSELCGQDITDHANCCAPALVEALEAAADTVCSMYCPSVKTTDGPWHHVPLCVQVKSALAAAYGESK